jgi:hypothetical protein
MWISVPAEPQTTASDEDAHRPVERPGDRLARALRRRGRGNPDPCGTAPDADHLRGG